MPGVLSTEEIPANTEIVSIPSKFLLSLDYVRTSPELKAMFEKNNYLFYHDKEADSICLTVYLIRMLIKEDPFWLPYINRALSKELEFPYQWTDDLLKELQDQTLITDIKGYGKDVMKQWNNVSGVLIKYPDLFPKPKWDCATYMKLYKYVATHSFGGMMPCSMIVPFAECFNHENCHPIFLEFVMKGKEKPADWFISEYANSKSIEEYQEIIKTKQIWNLPKDIDFDYYKKDDEKSEEDENDENEEDEDSDTLLKTKIHSAYAEWWAPMHPDISCIMRTGGKPIPAGTHIFYSYGARTNADLLSSFGFILVPNQQDKMSITLWNNLNPWINLKGYMNSLVVSEEIAAKVETDYQDTLFDTEDSAFRDLTVSTKTIKIGWLGLPSRSLMSFVRKQQMTHYKGKDSDKIMMSGQVVAEFEIECLEICIDILTKKKKQWKSTVEEDLKILEEVNKTPAKWRLSECLNYRILQKKLLDFNIEAYSLLIEILKNISQEGVKYKDAYMKIVPKYEKDEKEVMENRLLFKDYLRQLAQARKLLLDIPYE